MKRFVCFVAAVATVAGVVAYMAPAFWPGRWRGRADLRNQNPRRIPRLGIDRA